jgi:hypothetical protein
MSDLDRINLKLAKKVDTSLGKSKNTEKNKEIFLLFARFTRCIMKIKYALEKIYEAPNDESYDDESDEYDAFNTIEEDPGKTYSYYDDTD